MLIIILRDIDSLEGRGQVLELTENDIGYTLLQHAERQMSKTHKGLQKVQRGHDLRTQQLLITRKGKTLETSEWNPLLLT